MFNTSRMIGSSLVLLFLFCAAPAQENRAPIDNPQQPLPAGPLVAITTTSRRVRFVSPGTVVQLRLEVYNETGQKLYDTEMHGGNVLDWHLQDGTGKRLPAGSYACVLTTKSLSGRMSKRVGVVKVNDHEPAVEVAGAAKLSTAQQQTIGPVEGNAAFTVLQESQTEAITAVTHDGTDGQLTSTAGALIFRTGDLFSGNDVERLRITPEGNVGIGTDKPEATLDVSGTVRATEGFRFSDGTTLDATAGKITLRNKAGDNIPGLLAAGTGTQDRLAKWAETGGAGTLTDTQITETAAGLVGIGTTTPVATLDVTGNINTTTQYNIGGSRILSNAGINNLFAGKDAGNANSTGLFNSFFGGSNGVANTTGFSNSFFGALSGTTNTTGAFNSFFGSNAGKSNLTGRSNAFFGASAGFSNTTASDNSFFGAFAGLNNTIGSSNAFFGFESGHTNSVGGRNSFFGYYAGHLNNAGSRNSSFGTEAGMNNSGQDNAFFGDKAGRVNAQGIKNTFIGAGAGKDNSTGSNNTAIGADTFIGEGLSFATAIGAGASVHADNRVSIGRIGDEVLIPGVLKVLSFGIDPALSVTGNGSFSGTLTVDTLGTVGAEFLCRNVGTHRIAVCSSSLRYKTNILPFNSGLNLVNRLRPIAFSWKESGRRDLGLGAEDVEKIEPLLVTYNDKGEVEGVKYDRIAVVLLNAVKEQQVLITKQEQQLKRQQSAALYQQRQLEQQQHQIDALRRLVCRNNPRAKPCK